VKLGQGQWASVNGQNVSLPFHHESGISIRQTPVTISVEAQLLGFMVSRVLMLFWVRFHLTKVSGESRLMASESRAAVVDTVDTPLHGCSESRVQIPE